MTIRGYLYAALVVIFAGVAFTAYRFYGKYQLELATNARLTDELTSVKQINQQNVDTINRITELRKQTDSILLSVTQQLEVINKAQVETTTALSDLRDNDTTAREYLDTAIPDSVRLLLDKRAGSGDKDGSRR